MKLNQKNYTHYVIFPVDGGYDWKIESGWEYEEDAMDRKAELKEDGFNTKVVNKKLAIKHTGSLDNKHWGNIC